MWSKRRELITATDAAALGAAQQYAVGVAGCGSTARGLITANSAEATMTACTPSWTARSGSVTVKANRNVDFYLAPVIGKTNGDVDAETTAKWGIPDAVSGLRPFGLCVDANLAIAAFVRNGVMPVGDLRITYGKSQPTACGGNVPGNWGLVDFDGGSNSNADTQDWVRNGYPGLVEAGTLGSPCGAEPSACYPGDTGAYSNSLNSEMASLEASGEAFALPVFDSVTGNGSNASLHLVAFLWVKLIDHKTTGAAASRYLTVRVTTGISQGTCCVTNPSAIDTGLRVVKICATDATDKSGC
jgi:hypothetical protein